LIDNIKWSEAKGTHLDEKLPDIKEFIGNELAICFNLEAQINFRFNDIKEKNLGELFNRLVSFLYTIPRQE
jgi:hypothetical protein